MNFTTRTLTIILAVCLIAATSQHLLVDVYFNDNNVRIGSYEYNIQPDSTRHTGQWMMQLTNTNGDIVSQTRFDPTMIDRHGTRTLLDQVTIPIPAPAGAKTIEVLDSDNEIVAVENMRAYCGDGLCEPSERDTCPQDCNPEAIQVAQSIAEQPEIPESLNTTQHLLIATIILIIIVLIGVLIHINRKKPNPIQMRQQSY